MVTGNIHSKTGAAIFINKKKEKGKKRKEKKNSAYFSGPPDCRAP